MHGFSLKHFRVQIQGLACIIIGMINLRFETHLKARPEQVWNSITSLEGLTREMMPLMRLTAPKSFKTLNDIYPSKSNFRCWVLLFGIFPIDHTDLQLKSLEPLKGFVEESNMASMQYWRHERKIVVVSETETSVIDELSFEPRRFKKIIKFVIQKFFEHRHSKLTEYFNS